MRRLLIDGMANHFIRLPQPVLVLSPGMRPLDDTVVPVAPLGVLIVTGTGLEPPEDDEPPEPPEGVEGAVVVIGGGGRAGGGLYTYVY